MAVRKFISIFTLILFSFFFIAGFTIISLINSAEAKAIEAMERSDENDPTETRKPLIDFSSYIDTPNPINFIVMVADEFKNTDTMILVNFDPYNKKVNAMFIPRDIYLPRHNNILMNSLYLNYGEDRAREIFMEQLNCNIKYHFILNYAVIEDIINEFGGINYTIPIDMHYDDPTQNLHIHFDKGQTLHMNGKQAIEYLRYRKPNNGDYKDGQTGSDLERIERQKQFLKEFLNQKKSFFYFDKMRSITNIVFGNINTNIDIQTTLKLLNYIPDFDLNNVVWHSMPGYINPDISKGDFIPDYQRTRELISQYFKGTNE